MGPYSGRLETDPLGLCSDPILRSIYVLFRSSTAQLFCARCLPLNNALSMRWVHPEQASHKFECVRAKRLEEC